MLSAKAGRTQTAAIEDERLFPANLFEVAEAELCSGDERAWWVVYTKSREEKVFSTQLAARHVPHYLPLFEKTYSSCGRKYLAVVPLFPGYVFVFGSEQERLFSLTTNRVSRTIAVADPRQLRADLEQVHRLIQSGAPLTCEQRLEPGNRVRIRRGAMERLEGTVIVRRGKTRLIIAVTFLQQGVSLEVEECNLEPLD